MKVRSFSDSVYLRLRQFRAAHKVTGHTFSLVRVPPRRHTGVNRVTLPSLEIHSLPLPAFYCRCMLEVQSVKATRLRLVHCLIITAQCTAAVYFLAVDKKELQFSEGYCNVPADTLCAVFSSNGTDSCGNGLSNHHIHIASKLDWQLLFCRS